LTTVCSIGCRTELYGRAGIYHSGAP
jgi:hypothetical protein